MDAVQLGTQMFMEIESRRTAGSWSWQKYLPGPIDDNDVNMLCRLAGCWCDDPHADQVRFYTNQNHPGHGGKP